MNMKKRLSIILIALVMVMCLAPTTGFAKTYTCFACDEEYGVEYNNVTIIDYGGGHSISCPYGHVLVAGIHCGGTATCKEQAKCEVCERPYGEYKAHTDANNDYVCDTCGKKLCEHQWVNGKCSVCDTTCSHTWGGDGKCSVCSYECKHGSDENNDHKCDTCGKKISEHNWVDGECSVCSYVCGHSGGTAYCTKRAVCEICGKAYGETRPDNHSGEEEWIQAAATHEQKWNCCGEVIIAAKAHEWENGECIECGYACTHSTDANHDHMCDICGEQCSGHNWVDGKCSVCGYACQHSDRNIDHMCDTCGEQVSDHNWVNGTCSDCGYKCQHSGGTAYCAKRAVCEICGERYGRALGHDYGEWTPNGDGTHSATCRNESCRQTSTADCLTFVFAVETSAAENEAGELTSKRENLVFCPVCGAVGNGERLVKLEGAKAEAVTGTLPAMEVVVQMHDDYLSIALNYAGKLIQPAGQVKITLPAELAEGKTLTLIATDGAEADLPVESDGEYVSFTLDFTEAEIPVMLIRLDAEA